MRHSGISPRQLRDKLLLLSVGCLLSACAGWQTQAPATPATPAPASAASAPALAAVAPPTGSAADAEAFAAGPLRDPSTPVPATAPDAPLALPPTTSQDPPPTPGRIPQLEVDSPEPLKTLLETYLDLARAAALPEADSIVDAEWSRLIASMPEQAAELARTEGYFATRATIERLPVAEGKPPRVKLIVTAGPQLKVSRLTLEMQGALAERAEGGDAEATSLQESVRAQWPLAPGKAFSSDTWDSAKNGVLAQLRAAGYVAASWSGTAAEIDPDAGTARIFVVADSGPLYRAGTIEVSGLVHHESSRVRGLAAFGAGDAVTEQRLQDYQERLSKTGLFDQVSVSIDPDPLKADASPVLVRLRESPLHTATTAIGFSTTSGPRTTLEHTYRRVFGYAITSRAKLELGRDRQAWETEIATHPDENLSRKIYGASGERLLTDSDVVLSQKVRFGRSQERPAVERFNFIETERAEECARSDGKTLACDVLAAVSLNSHSTWRRVDNVLLPTLGYTLSTQVGAGVSDGTASARGGFGRAYGRLTGYWPLQHWYTQARIELGKVYTPSGVQVPDSQRFRAGGDNSVRGYAWRSLAPATSDGGITGGRMLFTASAEVARPILASMPALWGAVFVDAGRAADQLSELKPALGYGLGVRWRSPVGPLSLDWAWGQEVHRGRLHLNVGVAF
ncbi:autotransporter assembly complex protein TamA [Ideonella sp.]|uniref:autotransporter assembly complex protein TamA n=1 Tax=Ideonella sp. TaxID=1929293 RepID=UPI003BB5B09B